jgi:hypothetical protein
MTIRSCLILHRRPLDLEELASPAFGEAVRDQELDSRTLVGGR